MKFSDSVRLGADFELDLRAYELRQSGRALKLERIPMDLLLLLVEQRGQLVMREQIIAHIWGKDVFLDADNSINAAIRKIRQALKDDPEHPRFIQTVTGKGYRFIAPVIEAGASPASQETVPPTATPPENLIGKKVSHYRVLQVLGGGGMGVVYKAEDLKLGRSVAMKFLPGEFSADAKAFERVQQEARAASLLDHPGICTIYEMGEHEGRPFIVMQLLQGQTLREWIEKGAELEGAGCAGEIAKIGAQICSALEAAHEQGIIHRDIKPANIFLTNRKEAKILDFGVAKFTQDAGRGSSTAAGDVETSGKPALDREEDLQETGASLGTPAYLSPEQVRGERLDARTDLFSLGLVLYEMATGQQAFPGDTRAVIHDAIVHRTLPPLRQSRPDFPAELERIIGRAVEKDRDHRYPAAKEMGSDLEKMAASIRAAQPAALPAPGRVSTPADALRRRPWRFAAVALLLMAAGLVAGGLYYRSQRANRLTEKDTIVIADFANSTGDPIFDDSLKQGLTIALHQSPFLTILSDDKVSENLQLMTRPPNTRLTPDVAREVCQRAGSKAYIAGAVAELGSDYVIGLKAVNCRTGDVLAREQITAASKEKVIPALGDAANQLRGQLGESLATVQKHDVPLEQATTPSLEALKAYTLAYAEANSGAYRNAIPFYKHAIELDPDFAVAYAHLGQAYANSSQDELAVASIKQAFQRRARASELEKFYIETRYYELVTGEVGRRIESLQLWENMYPRDPIPHNDLAAEYTDMGKYDQGLEEARDTLQLAPQTFTGYVLMGVSYIGLNRLADAKAIREKQVELKLADHWDHVDLYGLAYMENDNAGMQREIAWAKGKPDEYVLLRTMAGRAASMGKLRSAKEMYQQAMESALRAGAAPGVKKMAVDLDLMEAMLGKVPSGPTTGAAGAMTSEDHAAHAGYLYAMKGDTGHANAIAGELVKRSPSATYVNQVWAPSIRAEMEIHRGNPAKALEWLQTASPYEFGWKAQYWPNYIRGRAYLRAGQGKEAAQEFQNILDHRGLCLSGSLSPLVYSLSHLGLARALALSGDEAGASAAYRKFLDLWKDADPDLPVLKQAREEFAKLEQRNQTQ